MCSQVQWFLLNVDGVMSVIIVLLLCTFALWLLFKYEVRSLNLFSHLIAKGWNGINNEETLYIHCSYCQSLIKRGTQHRIVRPVESLLSGS